MSRWKRESGERRESVESFICSSSKHGPLRSTVYRSGRRFKGVIVVDRKFSALAGKGNRGRKIDERLRSVSATARKREGYESQTAGTCPWRPIGAPTRCAEENRSGCAACGELQNPKPGGPPESRHRWPANRQRGASADRLQRHPVRWRGAWCRRRRRRRCARRAPKRSTFGGT